MNNVHPTMLAAMRSFAPLANDSVKPLAMSRSHEKNLECIRWNLDRAAGRAEVNPTDWNVDQAASLRQAEADYQRFMAGEIQRHQMCHTAQELTTEMPAWATYGT